jgi:hypothetical protein
VPLGHRGELRLHGLAPGGHFSYNRKAGPAATSCRKSRLTTLPVVVRGNSWSPKDDVRRHLERGQRSGDVLPRNFGGGAGAVPEVDHGDASGVGW